MSWHRDSDSESDSESERIVAALSVSAFQGSKSARIADSGGPSHFDRAAGGPGRGNRHDNLLPLNLNFK